MAFRIRRIKGYKCPKCGEAIDVSKVTPLRSVVCQACEHKSTVPAMFDHFEVLERLGKGAFGRVFRARDTVLDREVAIKILVADDEETRNEINEAVIAEARAMAKLDHPNIVKVHNLGEHDGQPYIIMELLEKDSAYRLTRTGGLANEVKVLDLGIGVARGLRQAYEAGMLHMDVKPGNILFDSEHVPKVIDFGTAQIEQLEGKAKGEGNMVPGTPLYIAPETVTGKTPTFKSDIYSLGGSLFHILTGRPPFRGDDMEKVLRKRITGPAPSIGDLRPNLNPLTIDVIDRMLARSRTIVTTRTTS
ncbi:MAG: protein kinase [Phycisphaera sp.]|nr:protein kinase [Phycisphaera sp.]